MSEEELTNEDVMSVMSNVVWDAGDSAPRDWSNNLYAAAYDHVSSLVTDEGQIIESYPFVPGVIDTNSAFDVLIEKINEAYSEDPEESIQSLTTVVLLAFMAGAWVASSEDSPFGYNISLTKDQISQVVQTWVAESLN